jgi:hypothetical protein
MRQSRPQRGLSLLRHNRPWARHRLAGSLVIKMTDSKVNYQDRKEEIRDD